MAGTMIITGYVPIKDHPRTAQEYGDLGEKLMGVRSVPFRAYYKQVGECWLARILSTYGKRVSHSKGDNPQKNTLDYHIVQHEKVNILGQAYIDHPEVDTFVWVDYGVCSQPGVDASVINDFAGRVTPDHLALPGCWEGPYPLTDKVPCWRFCGSTLVVPRQYVVPLRDAVRKALLSHMVLSKNVWWEVNTYASVERGTQLPITWYKADHNASQFTNYPTIG